MGRLRAGERRVGQKAEQYRGRETGAVKEERRRI